MNDIVVDPGLPDYLQYPSLRGHKYGALKYDDGQFVLEGEPIMLEFAKRMFPGAKMNNFRKRIIFQPSRREICDLNWLLLRFSVDICPEFEVERAKAIENFQKRRAGEDLQPIAPPSEFLGKLYPYQQIAVSFLTINRRALLGDGMGLGKTWSALGAVATAKTYPVLVVCQTQVMQQWQRVIGSLFNLPCPEQFGLYDTPFDIACRRGAKLAPILRGQTPCEIPDTPFTIIHYGLLAYWGKELRKRGYPVVIFDEVQELRHTGTQKYSEASLLSGDAKYVWGCSVGGDSVVEMRGGPFGLGWVGPIENAMLRVHGDNHINMVDVSDLGIESRSWNGTCFTWGKVNKFFRHKCKTNVRQIKVCGDKILLTDDHSIFRADPFGISCIRSNEIKVGDVVPIDNGTNWSSSSEEPVDIISLFKDHFKCQVCVDFSTLSRKALGVSPQHFFKYKKSKVGGPRLPANLFLKHRDKLPKPTAVYIGRCKRHRKCMPEIKLSDWAYILGFYIGNGYMDNVRVNFAVKKSCTQSLFNKIKSIPNIEIKPILKIGHRGSDNIRITNIFMARIFEFAFGGKFKAYDKTIPGEWIITWPRDKRLELLQGLIDSDGHVSKHFGRIYYSTTSQMLARQLMSLLRSIGVKGSLYTRKPADGGIIAGKRVKSNRPSYIVNWSQYAMNSDFSGYRGGQHRYHWTRGVLSEGKVRNIFTNLSAPGYVYDLEMANHPSFVANGVLVHNSGSPIYGYGIEIWSVSNAIEFHYLGSQDAFTREWCMGYGEKIVSDPRALHDHLVREGFLLRRKAEDVAKDLPKVVRHVQDVDHDRELYDSLIQAAREEAGKYATASFTERGQISRDIERDTRQAAGISKAHFVADFVAALIESGERPLVYAWHHKVHDILQEDLALYNPAVISGRETDTQKNENLRRYIDGKTDLMILSLRSAAGLDGLQHRATCCVFAELDWSPSIHQQCETRIARIGVDKMIAEVPSYYCVARNGYDEVMIDVLGVKTSQFIGIMGDEPEDYQEKQEAEKRAKHRIQLLVDRLKAERNCNEQISMASK